MFGISARTTLTIAAIGAGAMSGVFLTFSTFVMTALRRLPAHQGLTAMQAINKAAPTPLFMLPLFGTAALGVGLGVRGLRHLDTTVGRYEAIGGAAYLSAILLTIVYHVPRNNALDRVDPNAADAADLWRTYAASWTAANHIRTLGTLAASIAWTLAIFELR